MPKDSPLDLPLPALSTALHGKEVRPSELIEEIDHRLPKAFPCFASLDLDLAFDNARKLEQKFPLPPIPSSDSSVRTNHIPAQFDHFFGLPIPVKDLSPVHGFPCAYGAVYRREFPQVTDPFISSLIQGGMVVPGKSQTSEMGMTAYTEPIGFPAVDNPRFPGCTPGGSSGGAAVAVALGLAPAAHASDGGGSIRVPAAATGLVGFKPAHVSRGGKLTVQGFITRSVEDAAFLHRIVPVSRRLRIGVLTQPLHGDGWVEPAWAGAAVAAANELSDAGFAVVEVERYGDWVFQAFSEVIALLSRKIKGKASPIIDWLRSLEVDRGLALERFHKASDIAQRWGVDVLLTPSLAFDPPSIGTFSQLAPADDFAAQTEWTPWASLFNMTGGAAISIPYAGKSVHLGAVSASPAELLGVAGVLHR